MTACSSCSFKVYLFVPDHVRCRSIDPKFLGGFQNQTRCRFSATTSFIWAVRAIVDSIQIASHPGKLLAKFFVYPRHLLVSCQSAVDHGLISYNDYTEPSHPNFSKRFFDSRKDLELFRSLDVVSLFPGQNAVSIKKDRPVHGQS